MRRSRQVGTPSARTAIRRERESILGRMAFEHLSNSDEPANALSWERAVQIASEVLQDNNRDAIEAYLRTMAKETGLFTEERMSETIRFIHLTFCEFFAAFEAVNGLANGWSQVLERHRSFLQSEHPQVRTRMIEVVPFAAGLLPSNRVHNGMTDIAGLAQPEVFIRCVLETQLYGHETWQRFASDEIDALTLTAPDAWDERWLTRLQLFSVALTEGERWADLTGRPPAARSEELSGELVGTDEQRLVRLFASFATQDAAASFRLAEACGVDLLASRADLLVDACAEPPFLALALERVEREPEQLGWTSVLAEASLRYEVVAATLRTFQPVSSWRAAALALPARRRWPRDLANTSNLASVALTLAIDAERESRRRLSCSSGSLASSPRFGYSRCCSLPSRSPSSRGVCCGSQVRSGCQLVGRERRS